MVFTIERDGYKFKELDLEVSDFVKFLPEDIDYVTAHEFSQHNISLLPTWKLLKTEFSDIEGNENLIPDICTWIDATLLLSPKAKRLLGDSLAPYGEFLPLMIDDEQYELFNCLTLLDSKEGADELVFKTTDSNSMYLYCQERLKVIVTELGFQGIVFV
jgi:hypothetical protein